MSKTILETGPLGVGTFTGPGDTPGPHRRRWQFTVMDGTDTAVLTDAELDELLFHLVGSYRLPVRVLLLARGRESL